MVTSKKKFRQKFDVKNLTKKYWKSFVQNFVKNLTKVKNKFDGINFIFVHIAFRQKFDENNSKY